MEETRRCWLCGRNGADDPLERHHIFFGQGMRRLSEKYGLVVYLCGERCHRNGKEAVHRNGETNQQLHEYGQRKWMSENNGTIEDFRKIFGRSYL